MLIAVVSLQNEYPHPTSNTIEAFEPCLVIVFATKMHFISLGVAGGMVISKVID